VNNNDHYERRDDRVVPDHATHQPQTDQEVSALAHHRDPSVRTTPGAAPKAERGIAWVRPSELPTLIGSKWAARGIDLQGELVRRSRRAPRRAARAGHKITRSAISRPESATPTVSTTEELGL
jgi:hypothetical protein